MLAYIIIFTLSFLVVLFVTPVVIRVCKQYNIVDNPDERRIHKEPIPRLGGISVIVSVIFSVLFFVMLILFFEPEFFKVKYFKYDFLQIVGIVFSLFVITLVGIMDDLFQIDAKKKLLFQILCANVLYFTGSKITFLSNLGNYPVVIGDFLGYVLTILWIVGLTNAINLIDGMDGALAGIAAITSFTLGLLAVIQGQTVLAVFVFALSGSLLGFLRYNFNPAKIFLGDTGSLFIGMFMSIVSLLGYFKKATIISLLVPVIIFAIPIFDTLWAILRRIVKRQHIFQPDKEHIHHKLLQLGLNQKQAAFILYFITIFLSVVAVVLIK
ncbi:MAG: MraY family glycosyltransferase [Candidatus Calescibacterium sp.]|nr:undecaprenyl/decaprenyl-phosphate alpha-N-acetylglucosaminyl 1-phosphate transferase [Candidatus Calescibacterium sp.]MDW8132865.1 MraY family glycosyltransferase [Candidatus Calescibacterium sp.]